MSYADTELLRARLGEAVFDEIYQDESDAAADLESAAAEIDGAIASRYRLPLTGTRTLSLLRYWTRKRAVERAYSRAAGSGFAENVRLRVEQVRKYLEMIRNGTFLLPDAEERKDGSVAFASCREPVFGRDNMEGF